MRKYWFDTEFNQVGTFVELISIGIVSDDGREYYAQNQDRRIDMDQEYVVKHVLPLFDQRSYKPVKLIAEEVTNFVLPNGVEKESPQMWAWYGNYDWVAMCGTLYGNMVNVPKGFPWNVSDLKQYADYLGHTARPASPEGEHNALVDARWNKDFYEMLVKEDQRQRNDRQHAVDVLSLY